MRHKRNKPTLSETSAESGGASGSRTENQSAPEAKLFSKPPAVKKSRRTASYFFPVANTNGRPAVFQSIACFYYPRTPALSKCLACLSRDADRGDQDDDECRFVNFRKVTNKSSKQRAEVWQAAGFLNQDNVKAADKTEWLPSPGGGESKTFWANRDEIEYAIVKMRPAFVDLCKSELDEMERLLASDDGKDTGESSSKPKNIFSWRRRVNGVKEQCDLCRATLFNLHWFCSRCGYVACRDCHETDLPMIESIDPHRSLHPATIIPIECLKSILQTAEQFEPKTASTITSEVDDQQIEKINHLDRTVYLINNQDQLLRLRSDKTSDAPLIISQKKIITDDLFTLEKLIESVGKRTVTLVDCRSDDFDEVENVSMDYFLQSFRSLDVRKRLLSNGSEEINILKLSDFPIDACFADVLPRHYKQFTESLLPFAELCLADGELNLLSHLPKGFLQPDMIKGYFEHGTGTTQIATSQLHLDVADAVNVMAIVEQPEYPEPQQGEEMAKTIRDYILTCQFVAQSFKDRVLDGAIPGAIWHLFRPDDGPKIETYLIERRNCDSTTPIHDQDWYLDDVMLSELLNDYNVAPLTIIQFKNDAIFIDAGYSHQVRDFNSCFKIAIDYVSPCRLPAGLQLDREFRQLPITHKNQEDKLQLKNVIYHAMRYFLERIAIPQDIESTS